MKYGFETKLTTKNWRGPKTALYNRLLVDETMTDAWARKFKTVVHNAIFGVGLVVLALCFYYLHLQAPKAPLLQGYAVALGILAVLWAVGVALDYLISARRHNHDHRQLLISFGCTE